MTSRERLLCAMRLDGPGELPIHVRGVPAWDDQWVQTRDPSYAPVVQAVRQYGDYCANWAPPSGPFLSQTTVATDAERIDHPDWVETITTCIRPEAICAPGTCPASAGCRGCRWSSPSSRRKT